MMKNKLIKEITKTPYKLNTISLYIIFKGIFLDMQIDIRNTISFLDGSTIK